MSTFLKEPLIKELLANRISLSNLQVLRKLVDETDLALIIQKIYDLNGEQIKRIAALAPFMAKVDAVKNSKRNSRFIHRITADFRSQTGNKVVVAEGDSWFNYPILLSDVVDWISMEKNLAVYSLASGGDWLLNMLSARKYVEQLSTIHPDVFLISGGGNDLVGNNRLAAMIDPTGQSLEYEASEWAQSLMGQSTQEVEEARFKNGLRFLSKDFYALLMFFQLQYYFIFNGILTAGTGDPKNGKFPGIKIITQGYDYAIPASGINWGIKPWKWYKPFARLFLGHGTWLKTPLELRGIYKSADQRDIVYTMIYLFNEMMIETGRLFTEITGGDCVFHVDSRGTVGEKGWTDELHPLPVHFKNTAQAFVDCINDVPSPHGAVYRVAKPDQTN